MRAGDELLIAVADRLRTALRDERPRRPARRRRVRRPAHAISRTSASRRRSPSGCSARSTSPARVAGCPVVVGASIGIAIDTRRDELRSTTCSATPTSRCTRPRRWARAATTSSPADPAGGGRREADLVRARPRPSAARWPLRLAWSRARASDRVRGLDSARRVGTPLATPIEVRSDGDPALPAPHGPVSRDRASRSTSSRSATGR